MVSGLAVVHPEGEAVEASLSVVADVGMRPMRVAIGGFDAAGSDPAGAGDADMKPDTTGWDRQVTLQFTIGEGWRIVAPAEMPAGLAALGQLNWTARTGRWESRLFTIPPSGLKQRMREHAERCLYRLRNKIREAAKQAGSEQQRSQQ